MKRWLTSALIVLAMVSVGSNPALGQQLYKYRDANGNLVYTDRAPDKSSGKVEQFSVPLEAKAPRIDVQFSSDDHSWRVQAINQCQCVVEFEGKLLEAHNFAGTLTPNFHAVLTPGSQQDLITGPHRPDEGAAAARIAWKGILGAPGAEHTPPRPYRAPFAIGSSYVVSQAYPDRFSHTSVEDQYAVDIALPDGTPVYAARDGLVINVQHDKFLTAANPVMLDQANMVEILHDDGTIAMYAHLHWDSVRVQPGQHVHMGDYIANSGNTGFSTGPHLHFAVFRNTGGADVSVPVQFAGLAGTPVTPQTRQMLTAY